MDILQFVFTVTVGHITVGNITVVCNYSWQKLQITFYTSLLTEKLAGTDGLNTIEQEPT